ncbi:hypothetical protein CCHL11_02917 [Colletotrichum chlorophyti]|uniref:Apple domain-containing protein n=1 Tax=Colletotrichum chlorophyti TaxID=708187 RepID=A0A1Q8S110_9PEZI|nr:hypothetical protein CCHL11_02917 [Colletotrichum chlorophyti]
MQFSLLLGAVALLTGNVEAAPKAPQDQAVAHIVQGRGAPRPSSYPASGRDWPKLHMNGTNVTVPAPAPVGTVSSTYTLPYNHTSTTSLLQSLGCLTSVLTSTTTVDVTFYITATTSYGSNFTSSSGTDTVFPVSSSSQGYINSTTSRAAWNASSTSLHLSTGYASPVSSSHASTAISLATSSESPCPDDTATTQLPYPNITSSFLSRDSSAGHITSTLLPGWNSTASATFSQTTEPCNDDTGSTSRFNSTTTALSTHSNSTASWFTRTATSAAQETRCDDETGSVTSVSSTPTSTAWANQTSSLALSHVSSFSSSLLNVTSTHQSTSTEEPNMSTAAPSHSAESSSLTEDSTTRTSTRAITTPLTSIQSQTVTPFLPTTSITTAHSPAITPTESCVIDTSMVPITSAPLTSVPSSTLTPTKTVCQDDAPTGKPKPGNNHCGVHGLPVGNYFLARFVENAPGRRVTLEGCYQFCGSVMNATNGCMAYRFYPERGLNVPRCDLYGSNVAYALDSINNDHPDIWFDLACGSPSDERWAHLPGMDRLRELGLLE